MGQKHSLEDDLITFRLTSKQLARSAKKCDKNMEQQKAKMKQAIKDGDMARARIYGQNVIREKNQSLNFLRLSSRIDAVSSRLEAAVRMKDVNKAMVSTVTSMSNIMKTMNVEQISSTMEQFEKQFEDMDVRSGYMEQAMDNSVMATTPPEEVDQLIQMVADEEGLKVKDLLESSRVEDPSAASKTKEKDVADDLEARLAALRKAEA